jgi:hypothetical protein
MGDDLEKENVKLRKSLESLNEVSHHPDRPRKYLTLGWYSQSRLIHVISRDWFRRPLQILRDKFEIVKLNEEGKQAIEDLKAKEGMIAVLEVSPLTSMPCSLAARMNPPHDPPPFLPLFILFWPGREAPGRRLFFPCDAGASRHAWCIMPS